MSPTATSVGAGTAAAARPTATARREVRLASSRICFWLAKWAAGGPDGPRSPRAGRRSGRWRPGRSQHRRRHVGRSGKAPADPTSSAGEIVHELAELGEVAALDHAHQLAVRPAAESPVSQCRTCSGLSHQACRASYAIRRRVDSARSLWLERASPSTSRLERGLSASPYCWENRGTRGRSWCGPTARVLAALAARRAIRRRGRRRAEAVGDLVHVVDEREGPHPAELLAQREDQHQRELREVRDRAAHVAQHDQVGAARPLRLVAGGHRDATGGDRGSHRAAEVERPAAAGVLLARQPGGQPPGQRMDLAAHLARGRCGGRR